MDYQSFINESAEYFIGTLNQKAQIFRTALLSIMEEFHRVCVKNDITYFMGFGTLLGAKRDGGLIPWDFDIDLLVKYEDKLALIDALNRDLGDDFYFKCLENDKNFDHFDMRICKKGTHNKILHVDIFYLIDAPDNKNKFEKYASKLLRLSSIKCKKNMDLSTLFGPSRMRYFVAKFEKAIYSLVPNEYLNAKHKKLCKKYSSAKTNTYFRTCIGDKNKSLQYSKEWFSIPTPISFEGKKYFAPNGIDEFLNLWFNGKTEYLPQDKTFFEFLDRLKLVDVYCKRHLSDLW